MRRAIWLAALGIVGAVALVVAIGLRLEPNRDFVGSIIRQLFDRPHHPVVVLESGGRALEADHNLPVITRATEYIATLGSNTKVFREIVRIAAEADRECPRLESALDLAVVRQSESGRVIALSAAACQIDAPDQETAWQREFDALWTTAEYSSVESALAAMRAE